MKKFKKSLQNHKTYVNIKVVKEEVLKMIEKFLEKGWQKSQRTL